MQHGGMDPGRRELHHDVPAATAVCAALAPVTAEAAAAARIAATVTGIWFAEAMTAGP